MDDPLNWINHLKRPLLFQRVICKLKYKLLISDGIEGVWDRHIGQIESSEYAASERKDSETTSEAQESAIRYQQNWKGRKIFSKQRKQVLAQLNF